MCTKTLEQILFPHVSSVSSVSSTTFFGGPWLVGGLEHVLFSPTRLGMMIQSGFLIFFKMVIAPPIRLLLYDIHYMILLLFLAYHWMISLENPSINGWDHQMLRFFGARISMLLVNLQHPATSRDTSRKFAENGMMIPHDLHRSGCF